MSPTMQREKISKELESTSFEYFYWFSRFEFALKENKFLKNTYSGAKAEPNWETFIAKYKDKYIPCDEAKLLFNLHPKRQIVNENQELKWKPVGIEHCNNNLCKVVAMLITVRNNLFHGGKHGDVSLDNEQRNIELLQKSKQVIDKLAALSELEADYKRSY